MSTPIIINLFHPVGGSMRLTTQAYKLLLRLAFNSDGRQTEVPEVDDLWRSDWRYHHHVLIINDQFRSSH